MPVNWCPALGTVLANEEVVDGLSERGGHPVIRKVYWSDALLCVSLCPRFGTSLIYIFGGRFYIFTVHCLLPSSQCGNGCSKLLHMRTVFFKI